VWNTDSGKAVITTPSRLSVHGFADKTGRYRLLTMRSNDQFNTTIYGYSDRFRGIEGTRDVVLMNPADIAEAGLADGDRVKLVSDYDGDDIERVLGGLTLVAYNLPRGTIAGYYPECNVLVPITHHDETSKTPASKSVPVRIEALQQLSRQT
jgi:anaerobic selenocysteine-containing dehydrogenase